MQEKKIKTINRNSKTAANSAKCLRKEPNGFNSNTEREIHGTFIQKPIENARKSNNKKKHQTTDTQTQNLSTENQPAKKKEREKKTSIATTTNNQTKLIGFNSKMESFFCESLPLLFPNYREENY